MKISKNLRADDGSASIEFIVLGLLAQALILGFGLSALQEQRTQLGVQLAARQAVRLVALQPDQATQLHALTNEIETSVGLAPGGLKLSQVPERPSAGELVSVRATIGGTSSTSTMRVPR